MSAPAIYPIGWVSGVWLPLSPEDRAEVDAFIALRKLGHRKRPIREYTPLGLALSVGYNGA